MKTVFAFFLSLLFAGNAAAIWSKFAHVTPQTEAKYELKVEVTKSKHRPDKYQVKFAAVAYPWKLAWLVVSKKPLSVKEQQLRYELWNEESNNSSFLVKTKILPDGIARIIDEEKTQKFYQLEIDASLIKQSYVYIDFTTPTSDGGYYYSIDLGSYIK